MGSSASVAVTCVTYVPVENRGNETESKHFEVHRFTEPPLLTLMRDKSTDTEPSNTLMEGYVEHDDFFCVFWSALLWRCDVGDHSLNNSTIKKTKGRGRNGVRMAAFQTPAVIGTERNRIIACWRFGSSSLTSWNWKHYSIKTVLVCQVFKTEVILSKVSSERTNRNCLVSLIILYLWYTSLKPQTEGQILHLQTGWHGRLHRRTAPWPCVHASITCLHAQDL